MKTNTAQNMFAACACAFALSSLPAFTQNNRTWDSGRASGDWD